MPTMDEIIRFVESFAPPELAEEWDNCGALVNCGGEVRAVMCTLDITSEVIREAERASCQLILAHHPVIFRKLARVQQGDLVYKLVRKHISALCMHTNLDAAPGGVNDILAAIFGLQDTQVFAHVGRMGAVRQEVSATRLAQSCAERFSAHVRFADCGKPVRKLAVLGGSGGGLIKEMLDNEVDCLITGEVDHHDALDAKEAGVSLISAGHFSTEFPVVPVMADRLIKQFPQMRVLIANEAKDPFQYANPK